MKVIVIKQQTEYFYCEEYELDQVLAELKEQGFIIADVQDITRYTPKQTKPNWAEVEEWLETWLATEHEDDLFTFEPCSVIVEQDYEFEYHRYSVEVDSIYLPYGELTFLGACTNQIVTFTPNQIKEGETELYNTVIQAMNINK